MGFHLNLETIARALEGSYDFQRVVIRSPEEGFSCFTRSEFWYWLPSWLSSWIPDGYQQENRGTIGYFFRVFGEKRVRAISQRYHLNIFEKWKQGSALSRRDVRLLFLGMSEVYKGDVDRLWKAVKGEEQADGELEEAACRALSDMQRREWSSLTRHDWDRLYEALVPFRTIETAFFHHLPSFGIGTLFGGQEIQREQRIYLTERIRREKVSLDLWKAWVAKSMLKRLEGNQGLIIPGPHGYFHVYGQLQWGGASLLLLRALQRDVRSIVKAQGTRTNFSIDGVLSMLDDLGVEVGLRGAGAILPSLKYVLGRGKCPQGFEQHNSGERADRFRRREVPREKFDAMGFSLGGAQLEQMLSRDSDLFAEAFLMCSPGVSHKKAQEFWEENKGETDAPVFTYGVEYDDRVNRAGGWHLGFGLAPGQVRLLVFTEKKIEREELAEKLKSPPSVPKNMLKIVVEFLTAFICAHARHTTLTQKQRSSTDGFHIFDLEHGYEDARLVQRVLSNDDWEWVRVFFRELGIDLEAHWEERKRQAHSFAEELRQRTRACLPF